MLMLPSNAIDFNRSTKVSSDPLFNSLVEGLAGLVDTVNESVGHETLLQDLLKSGVEVHWTIEAGDWRADFTANTKEIRVILTYSYPVRTYEQLTLQYRTF